MIVLTTTPSVKDFRGGMLPRHTVDEVLHLLVVTVDARFVRQGEDPAAVGLGLLQQVAAGAPHEAVDRCRTGDIGEETPFMPKISLRRSSEPRAVQLSSLWPNKPSAKRKSTTALSSAVVLSVWTRVSPQASTSTGLTSLPMK